MERREKLKRKRSKNFTELEVRMLIDIVIRNISIIENKKTDSVMWADKEKKWQEIAKEFEALTGVTRNVCVLRTKYDAIKHNIKAKLTRNKLEIFKTGGGSAVVQILSDYEEKLCGFIALNVEGLPDEFDCDVNLTHQKRQVSENAQNAVVNCEVHTMSREAEVITTFTNDTLGVTDIVNSPVLDKEILTNNAKEAQDMIAEYVINPDTNEAQILSNNLTIVKGVDAHASEKEGEPSSSRFSNWKGWTPKALKQRKHTALQETSKNKPKKDALNEKLDTMVSSRNELIQLQKDLILKEIKTQEQEKEAEKAFIKEVRELQLELLRLKIENQKLKMSLLQKQTNNLT